MAPDCSPRRRVVVTPVRSHNKATRRWLTRTPDDHDPPTVTTALFVDLTQAARSPGSAATRANRAADRAADANRAATEPNATEPAAAATTAADAATSAATEPETATTTEPATAATAAAAATAASATASAGQLHAAADVFLIENVKRGEKE